VDLLIAIAWDMENRGTFSLTFFSGMGEGWGDFFATILNMNEFTKYEDIFAMGNYSAAAGIRYFPVFLICLIG
jgi:hypothetical protein